MLLGDVIEADDEYTGTHSRDVVDLVTAVADRLGLAPRERQLAEFAALLHDVGKVKIPSEIINKTGPLDDAEWEVMKTHTILGEQMLEPIGGLLGDVGLVVRSCHERWDGTGYPDGVAGEADPARRTNRLRVRRVERDDDRPLVPEGTLGPGGGGRAAGVRRHALRSTGRGHAARRGRPVARAPRSSSISRRRRR
jgi:hypothetical protein